MAEQRVKVLLFGLGAIGGFYTFILGRNENLSVSVVARSNYESVKANGLTIESQNHGTHEAHIEEVLKSPADAKTTFDYIVITHKAVNPQAIPPLLKPAVRSDTTFVIIQNGVGNEEPFRALYPENTIISCVTWVGATQTSPGLVRHTRSEDMQMGLFSNLQASADVERSRLETFAGFLREGGTVFEVVDDIQVKRWEKVVWNAAWNPLTTITNVDTQNWLKSSEEATPVTKQLMREVIDVARRCGVPVTHDLVDRQVEKILAMPGIYSSMHTDAMEGRPLEVDVILGYPMRKARALGMDVPILSAVYALTMAVNWRLMQNDQ